MMRMWSAVKLRSMTPATVYYPVSQIFLSRIQVKRFKLTLFEYFYLLFFLKELKISIAN